MLHALAPIVAAGADGNVITSNPKIIFVVMLVIGAMLFFAGLDISKNRKRKLTDALEVSGVAFLGVTMMVLGLAAPIVYGLIGGVIGWGAS